MMNTKWEKISEGPWSKRRKHQTVVWNDQVLLLGGFDGESAYDLNDVWGWDGQGWNIVCQHAEWSGRDGHCAVTLNGKVYLLGGTDDPYNCKSDSWVSDDGGVSWQLLLASSPWPERWQHAACVHKNQMYITGGWGNIYYNDVWSSADGINWQKKCSNAPWKPRMFHSAFSFNGILYILGGHDGRMQLKDVWASDDDGCTWTQVCASAQWPGRQGHATVVLHDYVYVMGGFGGSKRFNDFWRSTDCAQWTRVDTNCIWTARQGHAAVAFHDSILLFGGFDEGGYCNNSYRYQLSLQSDDIGENTLSSNEVRGTESLSRGNSGTKNDPQIPFSPYRANSISLYDIISSIDILRLQRSKNELIVEGLIFVLGLVNQAVSYSKRQATVTPRHPLNAGSSPRTGISGKDASIDDSKPEVTSVSDSNGIRSMIDQVGTGVHDKKQDAVTRIANTENSIFHVVSNSSTDINQKDNSQTEIPENIRHYTDFAKIGSPFREGVMETILCAGRKDSSEQKSKEDHYSFQVLPNDEDMKSQYGSRHSSGESFAVRSSSMEKMNCQRLMEPTDEGNGNEVSLSSAALRENMEQDRSKLNTLQTNIRRAAESADELQMDSLISTRTVLCASVVEQGNLLQSHIEHVLRVQTRKEDFLTAEMIKLETLPSSLNLLLNSTDSKNDIVKATSDGIRMENNHSNALDTNILESVSSCTFAEWETIVSECGELTQPSGLGHADELINSLSSNIEKIAGLNSRIATWMNSLKNDNQLGTGPDIQPDSLAADLEEAVRHQELLRGKVKSNVDDEMAQLKESEDMALAKLRIAYEKGASLITSMLNQVSMDRSEITSMKNEVIEWNARVSSLSNLDGIKNTISRYISENQVMEEELLRLEDVRIDAKSSYEKASLKGARSRLQYRSGTGGLKASVNQTNSQNSERTMLLLKEEVVAAERAVKKARRVMRNWYREKRKWAIDIAPELFHYLPDLQQPGSVLGDGGFAENAQIPRRKLEDYDDIKPLLSASDISKASTSQEANSRIGGNIIVRNEGTTLGRHILLKAQYEGEDVVLKGFIMHNLEQRKGFDREISVLSKLRNEAIIRPRSIVEGGGNDVNDLSIQVTIFIEYPFYGGGNLSDWLKSTERKPWELQSVARQVLYGLSYLHDHGVVHKDVKPSNVLMMEDGRLVLSDFELSRVIEKNLADSSEVEEDDETTVSRSGTRGFMAPEIEQGLAPVYASDMYSFGMLLFYMHFPTKISALAPGMVQLPPSCDSELSNLIISLLEVEYRKRPSAAAALMHPYFRTTFVDKMLQEGEVVEQSRKLDAMRNMIERTRLQNRTSYDTIFIHRNEVVHDVLQHFIVMPLSKMTHSLKVNFVNEPGIDEGGLLTELLSIFFAKVFEESAGLFETCDSDLRSRASKKTALTAESKEDHIFSATANTTTLISANDIVLPKSGAVDDTCLDNYRAFGKILVKCLYEGKRIGSQLCPSIFKFITNSSPNMRDLQMYDPQTAKSLQWTLATVGVEDFGFHFEEVGAPELGDVNDHNKAKFVRMKINDILVDSRLSQLTAIRDGFTVALKAISEEAAPFMSLLSHTDWRIMLCGSSSISATQIISVLRFSNFPMKSELPKWLKEILLSSPEDDLRKFLIFTTGSPSLSASLTTRVNNAPLGTDIDRLLDGDPIEIDESRVRIEVRFQNRNSSLPVAHTCFFQLDIPNYTKKETLHNKLLYAIHNANTFEIV